MRGKHKSLYGRADRIVRTIEQSDLVDRVVLGRSTGKSHGQSDGCIRIRGEVAAGLRVLIYSSKGITEAVVFCAAPARAHVRALIEAL